MGEWQPIETAPKNNQMLLLLRKAHREDYETHIFVGFWGDVYAGVGDVESYSWCDWTAGMSEDDVWISRTDVAYWQALPAPPQADEIAEKTADGYRDNSGDKHASA